MNKALRVKTWNWETTMSGEGRLSREPSSVFNELRIARKFCDAGIRVEDVEFQIHKIILCKCSHYFRALFERWSATHRTVFDIPGLSPEMMQLIIDFAYTGSVCVTERNVADLLLVADQFSVMEIVQTCFSFLEEHLCVENCISIWQLTKNGCLSELRSIAFRHILDCFEEVAECEEFLHLSLQELTEMLDRDDLNVKNERVVFEAILRWITHSPAEREGHIILFLPKVRLALTSEEYVRDNVMANDLVKSNVECLLIATSAIQTMCHMSSCPMVPGTFFSHARPRLPAVILLAIAGSYDKKPSTCIEAYDIRANKWVRMESNMKYARAYCGTIFLNGYVYSIGGFDRWKYLNTVQRMDLSTRTWYDMAPMHNCRCYVSVTVLNGCIYALGGNNGITRLSSAEVYQPETNQWTLISRMHMRRSEASCTTFEDKVYICGGLTGTEYLQSAEYYSPETNQWTMIAPMISPRSGLGVVTLAGYIYAIGGFNGVDRLHSAEVYNPLTDAWHTVSPMLNPRSNFGIEVLDEQLFVVGGYNGCTTTYKVECYDPTTDVWSAVCDVKIGRSGLNCCVVPRLPNMADCAIPRDAKDFFNLMDDDVMDLDDID